nr:hypothetical protein [Tanacetum cinerariifolium]
GARLLVGGAYFRLSGELSFQNLTYSSLAQEAALKAKRQLSSTIAKRDLGIKAPAGTATEADHPSTNLEQGPNGVHVQVVGGLVEQQQVGALLERHGQVHAVFLAARKAADLLLLVAARKVELTDVSPRVDGPAGEQHGFGAARNGVEHRLAT